MPLPPHEKEQAKRVGKSTARGKGALVVKSPTSAPAKTPCVAEQSTFAGPDQEMRIPCELDQDMQNTLADLALTVEESSQPPIADHLPVLTHQDTNDDHQLDQLDSLQDNADSRICGDDNAATTFENLCEEPSPCRNKLGATGTSDLEMTNVPSSPSSKISSRPAFNDDLKVAEHIAKTRGLPPDMPSVDIPQFLLQYGYHVCDHKSWAKSPDQQPKVRIELKSHIEFGDHTQYELICTICNQSNDEISDTSWRTLRRLKHIREGLHDIVKEALGPQYKQYFGSTPFAHIVAPSGTTSRLRAWFQSLASCINAGGLEPAIVARTFSLLDGPGTPLYSEGKSRFFTSAQIQQLPLTAAMFGSKDQVSLPRVGLVKPDSSHLGVVRKINVDVNVTDSVEMVFEVNGQDRCILVTTKPLGVEFGKKYGDVLKVDKVHAGTHAEQLGLQVGWAVKSVCGEDVSRKSFSQASELIKDKVSTLPRA